MMMLNRRKLLASACVGGLALTASTAQAEEFVTVLTGGTAGVYYPLGVALAKIYGDTIPGRANLGAGDQGIGREPQFAAAGQG